jgi:hypothetical protein
MSTVASGSRLPWVTATASTELGQGGMSTVYLAEGLTSRQRDRRGSGAYLRDSDVGKTDNARRRCHAGERAIR